MMFNFFKNRKIMRKKEITEQAEILAKKLLNEKIADIAQAKEDKVKEDELKAIEENRLADIALKNKRKAIKDSNEFYLEMIADKVTENGIRMELDWNDVAIETLKKHGFSGATDEDVIYDYLSLLNSNAQIDSIAEEYVNENK